MAAALMVVVVVGVKSAEWSGKDGWEATLCARARVAVRPVRTCARVITLRLPRTRWMRFSRLTERNGLRRSLPGEGKKRKKGGTHARARTQKKRGKDKIQ